MPSFVKTAADEARWNAAKAAATKRFPTLSGDRFYAAANAIFHSKEELGRTERRGNPGKPEFSEQFPKLEGKPMPFDRMEKHVQPTADTTQKKQERYYDNRGARKQIQRRIPLGPGGEGRAIGRLTDSVLAQKAR